MPYKRGRYYYLDLTLSDGRRLVRSTRETSKRRATQIESTVREMDTSGRHGVLDALIEGKLTPRRLHALKVAGRLEEALGSVSDPPLTKAVESYLRHEPKDRAREAISALMQFVPGGAPLSWLNDLEHLRELVAEFRRAGYAAGTEKLYMGYLGRFIRSRFGTDARKELYRELSLRRPDNERCVWLTPQELLAVRELCSPKLWVAVSLACSTGIRLGELVALVARDADTEQEVLRIRRGKSPSSRRQVPLAGEPLQVTTEHIERQGLGPRDRLLGGWKGYSVYNRWKRIRDHLELLTEEGEPVRFHDLRHHYAVYMARSGMPLTELRDRLGHSSLDMVERYAIYQPPEARERYRESLREMGLAAEKLHHSDQQGVQKAHG